MKLFTVIDTKTGKEADPKEIAFTEKWAMDLWYCDMEGFFIGADGTIILADECGNFKYVHWAEPENNDEEHNNRYQIIFNKTLTKGKPLDY